MIKNVRLWLSLAVIGGVLSSGCFLVSLQKQIVFLFDSPTTIAGPLALSGVAVDLNEIGDYEDNKDKLQDVADLAMLGRVTNQTATATSVEIWMVSDPGALLTTESAVRSAGIKVWGSFALGANETKTINWNQSAQLFTGRAQLVDQIKGDGRFDLYAIGTGATYNFRVESGALVAVLSAAQ